MRCKGFSQCDKAILWTCADCQRPLCSFHTWVTACGPHGTHKHRQHRTEERERVRTREGGDGPEPQDALRIPKFKLSSPRVRSSEWAHRTDEVLAALNDNMTTREASAVTGVPVWTVQQMRRRAGIKTQARRGFPARITPEHVAEMVTMRRDGVKVAAVAARFQIAPGTVVKMTRPFGPFDVVRKQDDAARQQTIRELWGKVSGVEIARRVGLSQSRVSILGRKMGLPSMRPAYRLASSQQPALFADGSAA